VKPLFLQSFFGNQAYIRKFEPKLKIMETLKVAFLLYVLTASTLGAFRYASIKASVFEQPLTFDLYLTSIPKAIMFDWLFFIDFIVSKFKK
jgi:hypothetical protein